MQVRIKEGRVAITRKEYGAIKRLDRQYMEKFLQAVYEAGKEDGKPEIPEEMRIRQGMSIAADAVVKALEDTKGIGERRREETVTKFREYSEAGFKRVQETENNSLG